MFRRALLLILCLLLLALPVYAQDTAAQPDPAQPGASVPVPAPDVEQQLLADGLKLLTPDLGDQPIYLTEPVTHAPYAVGSLNPVYLDTGLRYLNYLRALAGLAPVTLDDHLCLQAQYGAVVLAAGDTLTHSPAQPPDMDSSFYRLGATCCADSNVSMRYHYQHETLLQSALQGYMNEGSAVNRLDLGHRRWLLNPSLGKIGFGLATSASGKQYIAMPIMDRSGTGPQPQAVCWPSEGQFPNSLFAPGTPWSVSLDPAVYETPAESQLQVTVKRLSDGRIFTPGLLDNTDTLDSSGTYLLVSTKHYGTGPCISFSIGKEALGQDQYVGDYTVSVSGLRLLDGSETTLSYTVRFFDPAALSAPSEWAMGELTDAAALGLIPQSLTDRYQSPITRLEFCRLTMQALRQATGLDNDQIAARFALPGGPVTFTDCQDADMLAAAAIGAVRGMGDGTFRPDGSITRQDAAVLLMQTVSALTDLPAAEQAPMYLDGDDISDYAKPAVHWASLILDPTTGSPVMAGVGGGRFDPKGTYTREQAILTLLRLYRAEKLTAETVLPENTASPETPDAPTPEA